MEVKEKNKYGNDRSGIPTKIEIAVHWGFPIDDLTYCWGCGDCDSRIERSHLLAKYAGGDNNPDNFVLLCKFCHNNIQEQTAGKSQSSKAMKKLFKNAHLPFFQLKYNFLAMKFNAGLYPNKIYKNTPKEFKMPLMKIEHMSNKLTLKN